MVVILKMHLSFIFIFIFFPLSLWFCTGRRETHTVGWVGVQEDLVGVGGREKHDLKYIVWKNN